MAENINIGRQLLEKMTNIEQRIETLEKKKKRVKAQELRNEFLES